MASQSEKIRLDFLKALGIHDPCPNDMKFIEAIPDSQLLKAICVKAWRNGTSIKLLASRYSTSFLALRKAVYKIGNK